MKAKELYKLLDDKFIVAGLYDVWYKYMTVLDDYLCDNFKETDMGLMCDFADQIDTVYTAVFPSDKVMNEILNEGATNAMLFVHHACDWDSRNTVPFIHINTLLLDKFRERNISIYVIHVPLDNYSEYSTGNSFAESLDLKVESKFGDYRGSKCGVVCKTDIASVEDLKNLIEKVVCHEATIYPYGEDRITNSRVAIITGGGNDSQMLQEVVDKGVNTYVTGVTNLTMTSKAHQFAKENNINLIGATHYSTEKFACIKMVDFFKKIGIRSFYIEDNAVLEDM